MSRPRSIGPSIPLIFWTFVELMRDRKASTARFSARQGCARLAKEFAKDFKGGRFMTTETIRRFHKSTEAASAEQKAEAARLLQLGRQRREVIGWDASPWLFLFDPNVWPGYSVVELRDDKFVAKRQI
jgi:hypothetical protein